MLYFACYVAISESPKVSADWSIWKNTRPTDFWYTFPTINDNNIFIYYFHYFKYLNLVAFLILVFKCVQNKLKHDVRLV